MVKRNIKLPLICNKNILKKFSACIIATLMVMSGLPMNMGINEKIDIEKVYASETLTYVEENATYHYKIKDDETIIIKDYEGIDTKIKIPDEINGKKVTEIGSGAFSGCSSLIEVIIPENVTIMGEYVFEDCWSLEDIIIPEEVTKIYDYAFYRCSSLKKITIPESVTSIGASAFEGCSGLEEIIIPEKVTRIGCSAFAFCSNLKKIEISKGVVAILEDAFRNCDSLKEIIVDEDNVNYKSEEGVLFNKDMSELKLYPKGKEDIEYKVPEEVKTIDFSAFYGCNRLRKVEIPKGTTEIGQWVFLECNNLKEIIVDKDNINYKSEEGVLFNKEMTELKVYPEGKEGVEYIIPESVTTIGFGAFYGCNNLERIEIQDGVIKIDP